MAKASLKTDWAPTLRAAIKDGIPRGWSIYQRNGHARLRVRTGACCKYCLSKDLPIAWAISNIATNTDAVAELHPFTKAGAGQSWVKLSAQLNHSSVGHDQPGVSKPISGINWQMLGNSHNRVR